MRLTSRQILCAAECLCSVGPLPGAPTCFAASYCYLLPATVLCLCACTQGREQASHTHRRQRAVDQAANSIPTLHSCRWRHTCCHPLRAPSQAAAPPHAPQPADGGEIYVGSSGLQRWSRA